MLNLLLALIAERVAPLPTKVASAVEGKVLCVQMTTRALLVAGALSALAGSVIFFGLPVLVGTTLHIISWTEGGVPSRVAVPRGVWAVLGSVTGLVVAVRFLGLYARGLAVVATGDDARRPIRYTLSDPRRGVAR
jgi:hypothetical protein